MTSPSIDGTATGAVGNNNSSKSVTLTTSTSGLIIVYAGAENHSNSAVTSTVASVTASGLTFLRRSAWVYDYPGDPYRMSEVWYAVSGSAQTSLSITVTFNAAVDSGAVVAFGAMNCTGWDNDLSLPQVSNSTSAWDYSTNQNDDLVLYFAVGNSPATAPTGGSPGPTTFTLVNNAQDNSGFANCGVAVYSASVSASFTNGTVTMGTTLSWFIMDALTNDTQSQGSAPPLDGANSAIIGYNTSTSSMTLTTTKAGVLVAIICTETNSGSSNGATVSSITTSGLTWTRRGGVDEAGGGSGVFVNSEIWYAISSAAQANKTISLTLNANVDGGAWSVFGIAGTNTSTPFDANGGLPVFSNTSASINYSTTTANDTLIYVSNSGANAGYATPPSGFTGVSWPMSYNGGFGGVGYWSAIQRVSGTLSSQSEAGSGGSVLVTTGDALQPAPSPVAQFTQLAAEVLASMNASANFTQIAAEVLASGTASISVGQVVAEVLRSTAAALIPGPTSRNRTYMRR